MTSFVSILGTLAEKKRTESPVFYTYVNLGSLKLPSVLRFVLVLKNTRSGFGYYSSGYRLQSFPMIPQQQDDQPEADSIWPNIFLLNRE